MRLSDIKGEAALDVICKIIDPLSEIAMDAKFLKDFKAGKPKLMLVKYVITNHKKSLLEILAALDMKSVDEYMETVNLLTLPQQILDIVNDPEIAVLFDSQGQTMEKTSSGSATENTEAAEK